MCREKTYMVGFKLSNQVNNVKWVWKGCECPANQCWDGNLATCLSLSLSLPQSLSRLSWRPIGQKLSKKQKWTQRGNTTFLYVLFLLIDQNSVLALQRSAVQRRRWAAGRMRSSLFFFLNSPAAPVTVSAHGCRRGTFIRADVRIPFVLVATIT